MKSRMLRRLSVKHFSAPRRAENAYVGGLRALFDAMHTATVDGILAHRHDAVGVPDTGIPPERVGLLFQKMALEVRLANREAAMRMLGITPGADLAIERQILIAREANIMLVENAQRVYAASVREVMEDPASIGLSVQELRARLVAKGDISDSRAELIARDQTLKFNGQVNEIRQKSAGVEEYTWATVGDDRVRATHRAHEGHVFRWADPPLDTGAPGYDFQCRCVAIPSLDEFEGI